MITYEEFEKYIKRIIKVCDASGKINAICRESGFDYVALPEFGLVDDVIDLLSYITGDENEWVSWWCFEKDFGRDYMCEAYDRNNNLIPTNTIKDLYNLICGGDSVAD